MIRPATLHDVDAIFSIALSEARNYPELLPDRDKIRKGIIQAISSARHFAWVSENSKGVAGVIIGLTSENLWAERKNCLVALWTSKIVGDGMKLLKVFKMWVQSRRAIRVAGIVPDSNHFDPRVWMLVEHVGFKQYGGVYLLYN